MTRDNFRTIVKSIRPGTQVRVIYGGTHTEITGIYKRLPKPTGTRILVDGKQIYYKQVKHLERQI